ncbi:hypothetical protein EVAR_17445_1 [Eumeta japonica]|uniref:Uncharacterized protein n=1 Tax=Eumeta variegata TaxID=151549 RepID=A0A4C1VA38_EUMVA|nr:hypothetical protein EVAR_17445_1 [Eumeta japonica]
MTGSRIEITNRTRNTIESCETREIQHYHRIRTYSLFRLVHRVRVPVIQSSFPTFHQTDPLHYMPYSFSRDRQRTAGGLLTWRWRGARTASDAGDYLTARRRRTSSHGGGVCEKNLSQNLLCVRTHTPSARAGDAVTTARRAAAGGGETRMSHSKIFRNLDEDGSLGLGLPRVGTRSRVWERPVRMRRRRRGLSRSAST